MSMKLRKYILTLAPKFEEDEIIGIYWCIISFYRLIWKVKKRQLYMESGKVAASLEIGAHLSQPLEVPRLRPEPFAWIRFTLFVCSKYYHIHFPVKCLLDFFSRFGERSVCSCKVEPDSVIVRSLPKERCAPQIEIEIQIPSYICSEINKLRCFT